MNATKMGFNHAEAFCLMTYQCEVCGLREIIWNSRDGVTPFIVSCSKCGKPSQHVDWQYDIVAPDHKPQKGERIFISITTARAKEIAEKRLSVSHPGYPAPKKDTPEYERLLPILVADIYGTGDSPTSVEWEG